MDLFSTLSQRDPGFVERRSLLARPVSAILVFVGKIRFAFELLGHRRRREDVAFLVDRNISLRRRIMLLFVLNPHARLWKETVLSYPNNPISWVCSITRSWSSYLKSHPHRTALFAENPLRTIARRPSASLPPECPVDRRKRAGSRFGVPRWSFGRAHHTCARVGNLHMLVVIEHDFRRPSHSVVKRRRQSRIANDPMRLEWPFSEAECSIRTGRSFASNTSVLTLCPLSDE